MTGTAHAVSSRDKTRFVQDLLVEWLHHRLPAEPCVCSASTAGTSLTLTCAHVHMHSQPSTLLSNAY